MSLKFYCRKRDRISDPGGSERVEPPSTPGLEPPQGRIFERNCKCERRLQRTAPGSYIRDGDRQSGKINPFSLRKGVARISEYAVQKRREIFRPDGQGVRIRTGDPDGHRTRGQDPNPTGNRLVPEKTYRRDVDREKSAQWIHQNEVLVNDLRVQRKGFGCPLNVRLGTCSH